MMSMPMARDRQIRSTPPARAGTERLAPNLGEHNTEVLEEAGFSADEIAKMKDEGALG